MSCPDEMRLITKVASLYYQHRLRQTDIADRLALSQAKVSRLLRRALEENIVRITVSAPLGCHPKLEEELELRYGIQEAVVVDSGKGSDELLRNLGSAAAFYLETTIRNGEKIGVSSWSETLLATANAMQPLDKSIQAQVIQILGGMGNPTAEIHAGQLTRRLATLVNGDATVLSAPGVVGSAETRQILLEDPFVKDTVEQFDDVTLALVGIGSLEPSRLLASSGNVFSQEELDLLRENGAVGDICLRFFNADGIPVEPPLEQRVIGMSLSQLSQVKRTVAVAGGARKLAAIGGALRGGWINVLVTDHLVAQQLVEEAS